MKEIETHPFEPFMPENARMMMLGTFPPARKRWCMEFYYPNFQNDMWRIFGLVFFGDKNYFVVKDRKTFDVDDIVALLKDKGIATLMVVMNLLSDLVYKLVDPRIKLD